MEDVLQRFADRLAGVENVLIQERTARLSTEADFQSFRAQVTPTRVPLIVDDNALEDSVLRVVVAAQSASRTEPLDSRDFSKLDKFRSERTRWNDWAAVLHRYHAYRDGCGRVKDCSDTHCAMIDLDSVARSQSLHFMLTMLVEDPALDIILNIGQKVTNLGGDWFWNMIFGVRAAGSMMEILSHLFKSYTSSFEAFNAKVSIHERTTSKAIDDDVRSVAS